MQTIHYSQSIRLSTSMAEPEEREPSLLTIAHQSENCQKDPVSKKNCLPDIKDRLTTKRSLSKDPLLWKPCRESLFGDDDEFINYGPILTNETISSFDASLSSLLWTCSKSKDLKRGIQIHHVLEERGFAERDYADALITMYARCGELQKARKLLDIHKCRSVIPWNALISSYAREGQGQNALNCFEEMQGEGLSPSAVSYTCVLKACAVTGTIVKGMQIHDEILRQQLLEHSVELGGALVDMYARCGSLLEAHDVLEELPTCDVASWNALITGYTQQGQVDLALECIEAMQHRDIYPNAVTYVCILKACTVSGAIERGMEIHNVISRQGLLKNNLILGGALVDMYAKCGDLSRAKSVLESLPSRDVISWNALISGFAQKEQVEETLNCVQEMQNDGISPNAVTYLCILKSCAVIRDIEKGKQIHAEILRRGFLERSVMLGSALVNMYAQCSALLEAQSVFEILPVRDVVCWNAMIGGFAQKDEGQKALEFFQKMQSEGIPPNSVTYLCALKACAVTRDVNKGKQIHQQISRQGLLGQDLALGSALVDMYAKCGALQQAHSVLDKLSSRNVASWNALIAGYAHSGQGQQALECFEQMKREGLSPNVVTDTCILQACAVTGNLEKGQQIHNIIVSQGLLQHNIELGGALVDMYAKCGVLLQARTVLEELPSRDVVSWSALIAGYAQEGQVRQALECVEWMQFDGVHPNAVTYVSILKACAVNGALEEGKKIHDEIARKGLLGHDVILAGALVDMYVKCSALSQAKSVLQKLPFRNVILWNALVAGYAQEGNGEEALKCFEQMHCEGIFPDKVTFFCLLNLCSHLGLVQKGLELFDSMEPVYGLKPDVECYTCMVDLLGRTGHEVRAVELIQKMPFPPNLEIWLCLLGACLEWVNVNIAIWAFEQAIKLDKCNGPIYVLMANIYGAAGMPEKAEGIKALRIKNKA